MRTFGFTMLGVGRLYNATKYVCFLWRILSSTSLFTGRGVWGEQSPAQDQNPVPDAPLPSGDLQ